ncbi:AraC family transcriptional regulator [Flavivirga jejuensis]|uniref:Helix-turn-helix transcriptional regulator n=1 Tax=Flavivirga jejuensis TaxID=870487 RepID=A0ABT8WL55_9FLAO|nr:helix-turn-helix domain-containing protein [Flavivirga jejuensis]MDO5973719.1 helix-turn-helix transcriptional regulator [Flavivirga jejuensis]
METLKTNFEDAITEELNTTKYNGFTKIEYRISPQFGRGIIIELHLNNIVISISKFILNQDLTVKNQAEKHSIQLAFLLEGEKIIRINSDDKELPFESQESYMASISPHKGYNRISGEKPFKEIKISLSKQFLSLHGLDNQVIFKKITDANLIIPITNDLFSVLSDLETKKIKGISQKIYLEAKVLEILAIQIDNYKNRNVLSLNLKNNKHLKKLFILKQFLQTNLDKNYTIPMLVKHIGVNENLLRSEFKRVFNCTISEYFTKKKMNKAKHLLENTELPIYEISENVGYKNATHFSAAFKRFYNETPKEFRIKICTENSN